MSDIADLTTILRYVIEDPLKTQAPGDIFTYGSSAIFTLSETKVASVTAVLRNDSALSESSYSYSSTTNKVTITSSLTSGDTIEIQYTYYANFSASELEGYLRAAVVYLSANNYYTYEVDVSDDFFPDITDREKNLLVLVASILINKPISALRLPDMSLQFPETMNTQDKISKIIAKFKRDTHGDFAIIRNIEEISWNPPTNP